jgi:hypothetical protein
MILNPNTNKWVHFGQIGFEDFTYHKDEERRLRYLKRATKLKEIGGMTHIRQTIFQSIYCGN